MSGLLEDFYTRDNRPEGSEGWTIRQHSYARFLLLTCTRKEQVKIIQEMRSTQGDERTYCLLYFLKQEKEALRQGRELPRLFDPTIYRTKPNEQSPEKTRINNLPLTQGRIQSKGKNKAK